MKLYKTTRVIESGLAGPRRSACWVSCDHHFFFKSLGRSRWRILAFVGAQYKKEHLLLVGTGLDKAVFPTRAQAIASLELALQGANLD